MSSGYGFVMIATKGTLIHGQETTEAL
jgi:hypothetical protein